MSEKPTHKDIETGALVFPQGYPPEALEPLEEGFWEIWESEQELINVRIKRDKLLQESDKYMLQDFPITNEKRNEWIIYRQALRDLPLNIPFQWPTKPS